MRAISLWQPWASLYVAPWKWHETRGWATSHRGLTAIHAAQRFEKDHSPALAAILRKAFGPEWYKNLPTGAIIGTVEITDCFPTEESSERGISETDIACGDWSPGRFAWSRKSSAVIFPKPIPYKGRQGFFNVPDDLLKEAA